MLTSTCPVLFSPCPDTILTEEPSPQAGGFTYASQRSLKGLLLALIPASGAGTDADASDLTPIGPAGRFAREKIVQDVLESRRELNTRCQMLHGSSELPRAGHCRKRPLDKPHAAFEPLISSRKHHRPWWILLHPLHSLHCIHCTAAPSVPGNGSHHH